MRPDAGLLIPPPSRGTARAFHEPFAPGAAGREDLQGAHAVVAEFIVGNRFDVATGTTRSIAGRCGVSNATVVRTARLLGYAGFKELREAARESILD